MWDFSHFYGIKIYMINSKTKKAPEYRIVYIGKESDNKETGIRRHYIPVEKPEDFKIQQKIEEIEQDEWEKEIMNLSNNYKSNKKLFEIRAKGKDGIARVFYFTASEQKIILLHGFIKKTVKTPREEIEIALKRMKEVLYG